MVHDRINSVRLLSVLVGILFIMPSSLVNPVTPVLTEGSPNSQQSDPQKLYKEGEFLLKQGTRESLPQALEKYQQALPIYKEVSDRPGEAYTLSNMGDVYSDMGQRQQALIFYQQALPIYKEIGARSGEVSTFKRIRALSDPKF